MNNYRGPGIYRHHKGNEYEVLGLGVREETVVKPDDDNLYEYDDPVIVVVYRPLSPGTMLGEGQFEGVEFWTRDLDDFNADVTVPDAKGIGMTQGRFVFISGPDPFWQAHYRAMRKMREVREVWEAE